jgi:hypothetical protein
MPNYQGISSRKQANRKKSKGKTSKYFGVSSRIKHGRLRWRALIRLKKNPDVKVTGKVIDLGLFPYTEDGEKTAALRYITEAEKYYKQPVRIDDPVYNALCTRNTKTNLIEGAQ